MSVTVNGSNGLTFNDGSTQATAPKVGMVNRIINGAMQIDQRNAGASVTPSNGAYTLDRWTFEVNPASKLTCQQSSVAPAGFTNSMLITSTSAYSVGSGDYFDVQTRIEGFNCADLGWGTANAQTVTLSFWVRSSLTGTFGGSLKNSAGNRAYPFTYSISSANTWEQKSITVAGDTTGTWLTNNGTGIQVIFGLGMGSTFSGTAGAWAAGNYASATGATSVVGTNGATFYITGVQLEKGSTATSFDYRPYGTELALCQRYFYKYGGTAPYEVMGSGMIIGVSGGGAEGTIQFPTVMRTAPTSAYSTLQLSDNVNTPITVTSLSVDLSGTTSGRLVANGSGTTQYRMYSLRAANSTSGYLTLSAEL